MRLSIPLTLLLGLVVFLLVRKAELKIAHAVIAILFGFYLAATAAAGGIDRVTTMITTLLGGSITQH